MPSQSKISISENTGKSFDEASGVESIMRWNTQIESSIIEHSSMERFGWQ